MKKSISILIVVMLVISGCGTQQQEGITLTKEIYDELMDAKIENDRLKNEIDYLEQRIEDLTGQPVISDGDEEVTEATNAPEESETSAEATTQVEPGDDEGYTEEEIAQMTLVPFQDSYGYYGYKNGDGEIIIEAQFDTATTYASGSASVTNGGKRGTINTKGVISWSTSDTYKKTILSPRNDVEEGSDFADFLEAYRQALDERDEAFIKAHTHPNVKISFGGHSGWSGLVDYWKLDEGDDGFYKMMKTTLSLGAVDTSGGLGNAYTSPYVFTDFPDDFDAFTYSACIGSDVNVRTRPSTESDVITQVSYEVLKVLEPEADGWVKIQLPDGTRAYIYGSFLWSPINYRASFTKVDNTWLLDFFVKGD